MKRVRLMFFFVFFVSVLESSAKDRGDILVFDLPDTARLFIMKHFFMEGVLSCRYDEIKIFYQVKLDNNIEIHFDSNGNWIYLDSPIVPISPYVLAILPKGIVNYLDANYPEAEVYRMLYQKIYRLFINIYPKVSLDFDMKGVFVRKNTLPK